jgi:protein-L-isoaspartate(D-aspartate) O-methyltransferase
MMDFERARRMMVDNQLRTSNITDRRVLAAMLQVPRERFVPASRSSLAYIDETHPLATASGGARYLSAPAPFGRLLQLAGIGTNDHILDLGCASGYSTAVLSRLAATVVGVESDPGLAALALRNTSDLNNVSIVEGPLEAGAKSHAPFDVIMLEGTVDRVPEALFGQLRDGGRLVALIRDGATAVANLFVKSGRQMASRAEFNASLPPLNDEITPEEFVF